MPNRAAPLPVFIWYPSDARQPAELIGQNALLYGFHAMRDAPSRQKPAPVVVLSHGSGGNAVSLGWLASDLAARWMIVLATNHPSTISRDSTPEATARIWERPQDLSALIDFAAAGLPMGLVPDMDRIAATGFCQGGGSALSIAGVQVTKDRFVTCCETYPDKLDCGWMNAGGLDFTAIDAVRYGQSNLDARVSAVLAIDPVLPLAVNDVGLPNP